MKIKKIVKQALIVSGLMSVALMLVSAIPSAFAFGLDPGLNPVAEETGGETELLDLVLRIINFFLGFLGILAVIMVIYGGIRYVTSAGNDEGVGAAKKIILYSVVGLIIVLLSFVIINTVISSGVSTEPAGGGA